LNKDCVLNYTVIVRSILKIFFINLLVLYLVSQLFQGITFKNGLQSYLTAGIFLSISSMVVKPLINIMILPINLVTFGLFRWFSSTAALYVVTMLVPDFVINSFYFPGYTSMWFDIPVIKLYGFFAIILYSFAISIISTFLHWLLK
jgi:putative membrane protein